MDYLTLRKKIIEKYFQNMNDRQFEAVTHVNGPLLVLAGAGSGKTTVLVNRILNLVKFGNAYNSDYIPYFSDDDIITGEDFLNGKTDDLPNGAFSVEAVKPWQILAITFTNKAADELKSRIADKLGEDGYEVLAGTFHSVCGRILRKFGDSIGFSSHFTIYDTDDQRRLMKEIMKQNGIDEKFVPHKWVLSRISAAKDMLISPEEYAASVPQTDFRLKTVARLYSLYQKALFSADAMDFDDMIVNTVKLFETNPDALSYYNNRFRYVMVDEYQDTNHAQFVLVSLLSRGTGNLCVVGDDDQSIYRFRGATIENILNFEDEFKSAATVRLEQNYRSTGTILGAANKVIENNKGRKGKTLWTDNSEGDKITLYTADDERGEARFVADKILQAVSEGVAYSDNAVLYRMNAQSNAIESVFVRSGIPYKVIGGLKFYDRKEVKDVIAYLQVINNLKDDLRLKRIINEPKRGIGDTTVNKASEIAESLGISLYEVFKSVDDYPLLSRASDKIKRFCAVLDALCKCAEESTLSELFEKVLDLSGYKRALELEGDEGADRLENVKEFASSIAQYELESAEPNLSDFLEELALISDIDNLDSSDDRVVMMTVHSAKGLEFNNVYLVGLEEGIFPGTQSIYAGNEEIEEERRLAYVAITRAKKHLTVTNTYMRMLFGNTARNMPSRFLKEIPSNLCEIEGVTVKRFEVSATAPAHKTDNLKNSFTIPQNKSVASYNVGQTVSHKTFGKGIILSVTPAGNDSLLEIAFDDVGTKKLMANFAKLTVV